MAILILNQTPNNEELKQITQEYTDYIKVVVDVEKGILAAGGLLHSDAEKMLLENGSLQKNLWGGGVDLVSGDFDGISLINIRPSQNNPSQDILGKEIREKFLKILAGVFPKP